MAKRKETAAERKRREAIAEIEADLRYIYAGARGGELDPDGDCATFDELQKVIPAVCGLYEIPIRRAALSIIHRLDTWAMPDALAAWIHDSAGLIATWRKKEAESDSAGSADQ